MITHETSSEQCGPCSEISALRLLMPEEIREETVGMESESAAGVAARLMADMEETMPRPPGKTDSPSKRKGDNLSSQL